MDRFDTRVAAPIFERITIIGIGLIVAGVVVINVFSKTVTAH